MSAAIPLVPGVFIWRAQGRLLLFMCFDIYIYIYTHIYIHTSIKTVVYIILYYTTVKSVSN